MNKPLSYSIIVPYFRTPEITKICLQSIQKFSVHNPEIIIINNDPEHSSTKMLDDFSGLTIINNPTKTTGSDANFEALDIGIAASSNDIVALFHSDTIILKEGWDEYWISYLIEHELSAIGTLEREANPFRPFRKKIRDAWHHLTHKRTPSPNNDSKLMLFFLLTKKSILNEWPYNFLQHGNITTRHYLKHNEKVEVLSLKETSQFLWHISNVTSLLTGQMNDPKLLKNYQQKMQTFLDSNIVKNNFRS